MKKKNNAGLYVGLLAMILGFIGTILTGWANNKNMESAIEESINRRLNTSNNDSKI